MKTHFLIFLFLAITLTGCKNDFYGKTWIPVFVEEDGESLEPKLLDGYNIGFNFKNDTTAEYHNFRGNWLEEESIEFTSEKQFKHISKKNKVYLHDILFQSKDSLVIQYHSSTSDSSNSFFIRYIPIPQSKIYSSTDEMKFFLLNNYWIYEIDSMHYEVEFSFNKSISKGYIDAYDTEYQCTVHQYTNGKYQETMNWNWNLVQNGDTFILQIGDIYNHYYTYETFYITSMTDSSLTTSAWYKGKKANVTFKQKTYQSDYWNSVRLILTSKRWNISEAKIIENELDLGTMYGLTSINPDLTLKEDDLHSNILSYRFDSNKSFQLLKGGTIIQEGSWHLYPNGTILSLYNHRKVDNEYFYSIPNTHINILSIEDSILKIRKWEEFYLNNQDYSFISKETIQVWK
ncbi:hypothetical protein R9C00_26355 [Flammeovirgaceae bacterium SG7u.111]|nr:hypothetical protein [Flammeovirgaceae bacterium SG7u.132]WPO35222.1 hypothetical protein R9C00_26355 [Flammeovirgaceae bacterium SG7u.111]